MTHPPESQYKNITLIDLQLAAAYYPILIELGKHKHTTTYEELVAEGKRLYPNNQVVQSAIPVSTGRRLDVVRLFTAERGLPDLAALVISKSTGTPSKGYKGDFQSSQRAAFDHDWSNVSTTFDLYVEQVKKAITPRPRISRDKAKELMSDYYRMHKATLPQNVSEFRELIIELLMEGFELKDAFDQASAA